MQAVYTKVEQHARTHTHSLAAIIRSLLTHWGNINSKVSLTSKLKSAIFWREEGVCVFLNTEYACHPFPLQEVV